MIMRKWFLCCVLFLTTFTAEGQGSNAVHKYTDIFGKIMGESKVYRKGNEVYIDGFSYSEGISSWNSKSYSLDDKEFNQYLYYVCKNSEYAYIYVTIILPPSKDKYGNQSTGERITIGKIDTAESKRYKGFEYWVKEYNFMSMFYKDYQEYNEQIKRDDITISGMRIVPAYYPKSIK